MTQDLRQIIRDILAEELAAHGVKSARSGGNPGVREEVVRIRSDQDLARFVKRLMSMTGDRRSREEIESGRLVFRLDKAGGSVASPRAGGRASTDSTHDFAGGLITEKHIHRLPDDTGKIRLGPSAVLTPLAKDALRQSGIKIERVKK